MAKRNEFKTPYFGIENEKDFGILYTSTGDQSVIILMENPILQYDADSEAYYNFHSTFENIIKLLGSDYVVQKQDVFARKSFDGGADFPDDFLTQEYNNNFKGREYTEVSTYLVITKLSKKRFYQHDDKAYKAFLNNITKVIDVMDNKKLNPKPLFEKEIKLYTYRVLGLEFNEAKITFNNFRASEDYLSIGEDIIKSISLINIDEMELPSRVAPHIERNDIGINFPVDTMSFLQNVPFYKVILYNQIIFIPDQRSVLTSLEVKKKRHSSVPDPANKISVEDIDNLLVDVARENQLLVYSHYNIVVRASKENVSKTNNFIETQLFDAGIIPNKNGYNQLELFRCALPGNASELKKYDKFLTTADAALCFFFKERLLTDEKSKFRIYFSDRQGIPVAVDTADLPVDTGRINNRNKFVLGPSGSGKSFFMNHLVRQYYLYDTDIILVDTGHSYSGLCSYYKGKYITYTETKPITFNPFQISPSEYNEEKRDFLKSLVSLLWKGSEGSISQVEDAVLSSLIVGYFELYFSEDKKHEKKSFNSFFDYAIERLPQIIKEEEILFPTQEFKYILKQFYKGGRYASTLNDDIDTSLFDEPFIVFEIDSIKENKVLFPIVTMIIMDVFLQKMRHKKSRKALIIEEAWKAIASPLMSEYIKYVYKTVRKFRGEAVVVTQELDDIIGNVVVKESIINNSDTIIMLDQTKFKDKFDDIGKLLSISEVEKRKIFTINRLDNRENRGKFKEVYIKRGAKGEVYAVENSLSEYMTFTTERSEKDALHVYIACCKDDYREGLRRFIEDFRHYRLSMLDFCSAINKAADDKRYSKGIDAFTMAFFLSGQPLFEFIKEVNKTSAPPKLKAA